jgi:alkanesulfonate monooxygenase SsuD/methylene tetrahydromethanopterin reductase-like flavin-dependent oxidoreductase (luciferase family)
LRDPRAVAEDYLMLDTLSGGRCILGVGSGAFKWEFSGFGIDFDTKRERFEECLAIVRQAISGASIQFEGRHLQARDITINVPPLETRRPHMPLYVGGLTPEAARSIGRAGDNLMSTPFIALKTGQEIGGVLAAYRQGLAECPTTPIGTDTALLMHCHVAETDAAARARGAGPFQAYIDGRVDPRAPRRTYEDLLESGMGLFGSVEHVAEAVVRLHQLGAGQLILFMNFGAMPAHHVLDSMELFAARVAPLVHAEIARRGDAASDPAAVPARPVRSALAAPSVVRGSA